MDILGKINTSFNNAAEKIVASAQTPQKFLTESRVRSLTGGVPLTDKARALDLGLSLGAAFSIAAYAAGSGDAFTATALGATGLGVAAYHYKRGARIIDEQNKQTPTALENS